MTNQKQLRAAFWLDHPSLDQEARADGTRSKSQNHQCTDIRVAFCDYVDMLERSGQITEALAFRATL